MPFPWELHLDRPYHHENWPLPERLTRESAVEDGGAEQDETIDRKGEEPMPQPLNKIDHKLRC